MAFLIAPPNESISGDTDNGVIQVTWATWMAGYPGITFSASPEEGGKPEGGEPSYVSAG